MRKCSICSSKNKELRPYGHGGSLVCFTCAMKQEDVTKQNFNVALAAAKRQSDDGCALLTEVGLIPNKPRAKA